MLARRTRGKGGGEGQHAKVPTPHFPEGVRVSAYQSEQTRESAAVDDALRLVIVARNDVARGAKRGRLHRRGWVPHELDDARADARVEHGLDLLVRAVGKIRERPAAVREHLVVVGEDELREHGQGGRHHVPRRLRLTAAHVGERPGGVAQHRHLGLWIELLE
jgi:hypothetical protein